MPATFLMLSPADLPRTSTSASIPGAVPVPIYADAVAEEMAYVLAHAEVTLAIVQDQEQVDKIIALSDRLPQLARAVYDEPRGLKDYDHKRLIAFEDVQRIGRKKLANDPECLRRWEAGVAEGLEDPELGGRAARGAVRAEGLHVEVEEARHLVDVEPGDDHVAAGRGRQAEAVEVLAIRRRHGRGPRVVFVGE